MQDNHSGRPAGWPKLSIAEAHRQMTAPGSLYECEEADIRGQRLKVWTRDPGTLRALLQMAAGHGAATFLVYQGERVSFETFHRAACAMAQRLHAAGIRKGDRVALAMSNRPEWPLVFMAATAMGAIIVPLNAWWTGEELAYGLNDSGARLLFADAERAARVRQQEAKLAARPQLVDVDGAHSADTTLWIGPSAGWPLLTARPLPEVALAPEDDATIFYTSGTTGLPKGALGTHRNAVFMVIGTSLSAERLRLRGGSAPVIPGQRAALIAVPLFHVTGCFGRFIPSLANGTKLVFMPRWNAAEAARVIREEGVTGAGSVPTIAIQLLDYLEANRTTLPTLRAMSYGGAPASPELVARIRRQLPDALPAQGYGMTETSSMMTHILGEEYDDLPGSCGPAAPNGEMKVVDAAGRALPPGEIGQLLCRGPNIVKGYWNKPNETAETFRDGWLATGDLARLDAEGNLYIVDRAKDVIIRAGENIYSVEVEHVLEAWPGVKEAALVAIPHAVLGEEPGAVLYAGGGQVDLDALRAHAAGRLAKFKLPVKYVVLKEPLPRNANGKIVKKGLKLLFNER